jgi:hypothetical protein
LLCLWTFAFVPRYDHWPLGEGWALLLGGSLAAVIGAALRSRGLTALGALATFVAAASPYLGKGTEVAIADTASFYHGWGVDLGAASLVPTFRLAVAAWCMPTARSGWWHRPGAHDRGLPGGLGHARLQRLAADTGPARGRAGAHA